MTHTKEGPGFESTSWLGLSVWVLWQTKTYTLYWGLQTGHVIQLITYIDKPSFTKLCRERCYGKLQVTTNWQSTQTPNLV